MHKVRNEGSYFVRQRHRTVMKIKENLVKNVIHGAKIGQTSFSCRTELKLASYFKMILFKLGHRLLLVEIRIN